VDRVSNIHDLEVEGENCQRQFARQHHSQLVAKAEVAGPQNVGEAFHPDALDLALIDRQYL